MTVYPLTRLLVAQAICGPRPDRDDYDDGLAKQKIEKRWLELTPAQQAEELDAADAVIELFEQAVARGRYNHDAFSLRSMSFAERAVHKKRMSEYGVLTRNASLQSEYPIMEGETLSIYKDQSGNWIVRPTSEFEDGRFTFKPRGVPASVGQNPLQMDREDDGSELGSIARLRFIVDWQQHFVPAEMMLCWRIDVSRLLSRLGWQEARSASFLTRLQEQDRKITELVRERDKALEAAGTPPAEIAVSGVEELLARDADMVIADHKATIERLEKALEEAHGRASRAEDKLDAVAALLPSVDEVDVRHKLGKAISSEAPPIQEIKLHFWDDGKYLIFDMIGDKDNVGIIDRDFEWSKGKSLDGTRDFRTLHLKAVLPPVRDYEGPPRDGPFGMLKPDRDFRPGERGENPETYDGDTE